MKTNKNFDFSQNDYIWFKGDCLKLLEKIESSSVQLIITSPPYNIGKEYETKTSIDEYLEYQKKIISECCRVLKPSGNLCWQVGNHVDKGVLYPLDLITYPIFQDLGLKLNNRIIWHYDHGFHAKYKFSGRYETIMWYVKSSDYFFNVDPIRVPQKQPTKKHYKGPKKGQLSCNPLGKNPSDVWNITNIKNDHPEKIIDGHPCQFPLELVERLVLSMSKEGDLVLDPYGGTATTLIGSLRHNRFCISSEINSNYHKIGSKRIKDYFSGKLKTLSRFADSRPLSH